MSKVGDLHKRWSRDPEYKAAYDELGPEFELARSVIEARTRAGLTQAQLARRMKTTQSVIARLESGLARPSTEDAGEARPGHRHLPQNQLRGDRKRCLMFPD